MSEKIEVIDTGKPEGKEPELFEQFARIEWMLHRFHQHNHRMHGPMGDPHRGQGRVLALLKMQPEISQKDLSYLLDMRPQSVGELLAKLERGGFIERTASEDDRRVINIKLTEEGRNATKQQTNRQDFFDCLNGEEKAELGSYLNRIINGMEERFDRHEGFHGEHFIFERGRHQRGRHPGPGGRNTGERGFCPPHPPELYEE